MDLVENLFSNFFCCRPPCAYYYVKMVRPFDILFSYCCPLSVFLPRFTLLSIKALTKKIIWLIFDLELSQRGDVSAQKCR